MPPEITPPSLGLATIKSDRGIHTDRLQPLLPWLKGTSVPPTAVEVESTWYGSANIPTNRYDHTVVAFGLCIVPSIITFILVVGPWNELLTGRGMEAQRLNEVEPYGQRAGSRRLGG